MTKANKKLFLVTLAVFIYTILFDSIVHGHLLAGFYQETAVIWRGVQAMENLFLFTLTSELLLAAVFCYIFTLNYEKKGLKEGARFGLYMGSLLAAPQVGTYAYLPIPLALSFAWVFSYIAWGVIGGVLVAYLHRAIK